MLPMILAACVLALVVALLIPEVRQVLLGPVIVLLFAVVVLVGRSYWHDREEHAAPDGGARVLFESKSNVIDFQMRVRLDAGEWEQILYETPTDWCGPVTSVAWGAGSSQVAVFATDPCGPWLLLGYDLQRRQPLDAPAIDALLRPEVSRRFGWRPTEPLGQWLQTPEGRQARGDLR